MPNEPSRDESGEELKADNERKKIWDNIERIKQIFDNLNYNSTYKNISHACHVYTPNMSETTTHKLPLRMAVWFSRVFSAAAKGERACQSFGKASRTETKKFINVQIFTQNKFAAFGSSPLKKQTHGIEPANALDFNF